MARAIDRLTARAVQTISEPGLHADGGGLYLRVDPSGARRWAFIYRKGKKRIELGLGGTHTISLAEAREKALQTRKLVQAGKDPRAEKARQRVRFGEFADRLVKTLSPGWKSEVHRKQWVRSVEIEAASLRDMWLDEITTQHMIDAVLPLWQTVPETASRFRGRLEKIFDAAMASGARPRGENPARWKGHLAHLLPQRQNTVTHHPALPHAKIPAFMRKLRKRRDVSSRALDFTILTAARTGETIGAQKPEFDLDKGLWTVPGGRMKEGRAHVVPLSPDAVALLKSIWPKKGKFVFQSRGKDEPLSNMAMTRAIEEMGYGDFTVHGFRSTFKDWAKEETAFENWLSEAALSHAVGDRTERSYSRGQAITRRRELMDAWAAHCRVGT